MRQGEKERKGLSIKCISSLSLYLPMSPFKGGNQYKAFRLQGQFTLPCPSVPSFRREYKGGASQTSCSIPFGRLSRATGNTVVFLQLLPTLFIFPWKGLNKTRHLKFNSGTLYFSLPCVSYLFVEENTEKELPRPLASSLLVAIYRRLWW